MPVKPGNPHKIGTREWYLFNSPTIFDATKNTVPGTVFRTPHNKSVNTSIGSDFRPKYMSGGKTYGFVADQKPQGTSKVFNPATGKYLWASDGSLPIGKTTQDRPGPGGGGGGGGGRRGGGGGGGGGPDPAAIVAAMSRYKPQFFTPTELKMEEYKPPEFYGFNNESYDMMKNQIAESIANARTRGASAYGEAREQLADIPLAFQGAPTTGDPGMSAAMQRMFAANDTPTSINEATMREGVQADAAFGNVFALQGAAERQRRSSDERALAGDERRLNEELDQQKTMLEFQTEFARQKALEQYEIEKWQFGEQVARQNLEIRNQGIQANWKAKNDALAANIDTANQANQTNTQTLVDLLAQGVKVDPAAVAQIAAPTK